MGILRDTSHSALIFVKQDVLISRFKRLMFNEYCVVWEGAFKHKEGSDDATAVKTMTSVYRGGLDNLKKISE